MDRSESKEVQSLKNRFAKEKKLIDAFLFSHVPLGITKMLEALFNKILEWEKKALAKAKLSDQDSADLKNIKILRKHITSFKSIKYWQLLQVLFKFPSRFQLGLNADLVKVMESQVTFHNIQRILPIEGYEKKSLRLYLIDCTAFFYLRKEQASVTSAKKIKDFEKNIAIIPNHFLLLEKLGGKGIISVFRGVNLETNQNIVIKCIPQNDAPGEDHQGERDKFAREARAFAKLEQHRKKKIGKGERLVDSYFVKAYRLAQGSLFDFHFASGEFLRKSEKNIQFMVMRYIEGPGLDDLLQDYRSTKSEMAIKIAIHITKRLLEALDYCHKEGIVHRDICPGNILLTQDFQVRITNLGGSKVEDIAHLTTHGIFIGSANYTAPEGIYFHKDQNFSKLIQSTDHRFDIYSVGCIAYEMLVGQPPFVSAKKDLEARELDILQQHITQKAVPPKKVRLEISSRLSQFVLRLLAKKPENRFSSAQEAIVELKECLSIGQKANEFTDDFMGSNLPDQTQEFRLDIPLNQGNWKKKILISGGVLVVLSSVSWFFWSEEIRTFVNHRFLEYQQITENEQVLTRLENHYGQLQDKWERCQNVIVRLEKKFPQSQGYPNASERVVRLLGNSKEHVEKVAQILEEGKLAIAQGMESGRRWAENNSNYSLEDEINLAILDRIFNKLSITQKTAISLKKARQEEQRIRSTHRTLGTYVLKAGEWIALVDEKLGILEEQFPARKGYITVDKQIPTEIQKAKKRLNTMETLIPKLRQAIWDSSFPQAGEMIEPYRQLNLQELERLADINESVEEVLSACERIQKERRQRRIIDQTFTKLQQQVEFLRVSLRSAQDHWQEITQLGLKSKSPSNLFEEANEEISTLTKVIADVNSSLDQNKEEQVVELLEPYINEKELVALEKIRSLDEQLSDQIKIAQAPKAETVNKQEILRLLTKAKQNFSQIKLANELLEKDFTYLQEELGKSDDQSLEKIYNRVIPQIKGKQNLLQGIIAESEQQLTLPNLAKALAVLSENKKTIDSLDSMPGKIRAFHKKVRLKIDSLERKMAEQQYLVQIDRISKKLEDYISRVKNSLLPLGQQVEQTQLRYSEAKGYHQLDEANLEVLTKGEQMIERYQNSLLIAQSLKERQKLAEALDKLAPYARKKLGYEGFDEDLKRLEDDLARTQQIVEQEKIHFDQERAVSEDALVLQKRQGELEGLVPKLKEKMDILTTQYPQSRGYIEVDLTIYNYIGQAEEEIKELGRVLSESDVFVKKEKYQEARAWLKPYIESPGISLVSVLQTFLANCERILTQNKQLASQPDLLAKNRREKMEAAERVQMLKAWQKAPGKWYDGLTYWTERYEKVHPQLLKLMKDRSLNLIDHRVGIELQRIHDYPKQMAELAELVHKLEKKGVSFPKEGRKAQELQKYLLSQKIIVNAENEIDAVASAMKKLEEDLNIGWVEEDNLRTILRNLGQISRDFNEAYIPVKSALVNLTYN